jgi:serine protease Do
MKNRTKRFARTIVDSNKECKQHMQYRSRSVVAGAALVAAGAVGGAWITAKTGHFPFSIQDVPAAAQTTAAEPEVSFRAGFGAVVKKVQPAVVSITSTTDAVRTESRRGSRGLDLRDFFGENGAIPFEMPQAPKQGLGSGVIVSADGYILTNHHVIDGADRVKVAMQDHREFTAKVVGKDPQTDVAVLKIDATNLPHADFGNSDSVQVGDIVLALGNPFGIGQTVTMGIVGATHRDTGERIEEYEDFIQTDAAINPGNSGGALVNIKGELIGINTAILSRSGGNQGVGFAIPARNARNIMDQILKTGKVSRGHMGVLIQPVTAAIAKQFELPGEARGALISDVTENSPAQRAGLQAGDIVTELNGTPISDSSNLRVRIAGLSPDTTARLKIFRNGSIRDVNVVLGTQPGTERASNDSGTASSDGPRLGISVEPASRSRGRSSGLVVIDVLPGSAAQEAGLREGDVILEVNRKSVSDPVEFQRLVRTAGNSTVLLYVESTATNGGATGKHYVPVQPR